MTTPTKGNILLVDDDRFLAEMYGMKFTASGYQVQACLGAGEALKVLREGFVPDCVIFDLIMPEQDGFSFLQALSGERLAKNAALIALTNQGNDAERVKAEGMGVARPRRP